MKECTHLFFLSANPHRAGLGNEGYGGNEEQVWTWNVVFAHFIKNYSSDNAVEPSEKLG